MLNLFDYLRMNTSARRGLAAGCLALLLCITGACTDELENAVEDSVEDTVSSLEAPSDCAVVSPYAGTYTVNGAAETPDSRGANTAAHLRGTITVTEACAVDFDTNLSFEPSDVVAIFDRRTQDTDRRVQINYGADDDAAIIALYLDTDGKVVEIQYRDRSNDVNIRSAVTLAP